MIIRYIRQKKQNNLWTSIRSTRVKYRWRDVYTCACWRMSASMSSPSPSLSHCSVLSFGASISQFVFLCLRVTSLNSRPKRRQSGQTSSSQGSKCEHIGGVQKFQRGSKYFRRIWTGGPNTTWQAMFLQYMLVNTIVISIDFKEHVNNFYRMPYLISSLVQASQ